jgi:hypothetical protein
MRAIAFASLLTLAPFAPALAQGVQEIPGTEYQSGNWDGVARTDETGAFSHCAVSVGYTTGETFWVGIYPNDTISLLLTHPDVHFTTGQTFDTMWIMMETGLAWPGHGEAWDEAFAGMTFTGVDETIGLLTSGQYFRMLGIGIDEAYDISGSAEALAMAKDCLAKQSGSNPFATKTTPSRVPDLPKVPDLKPKPGGGLGTRPGGALGTPAPKPSP